MTVRANLAALTTAIDAAVARDASPLQSGDVTEWDPIRQLLLDMAETYYDAGTMRGIVLAANVIDGAMIQDAARDRIRDLLEGLSGNDRMLTTALRGAARKDQLPTDTVYDADLDDLYNMASWHNGQLTLTRHDGASVFFDVIETVRDMMATFITGGTDIGVTHDDAANTLTIAFTGTGAGSTRTDAQVQELARDAVAAALRGEAIDPRVTISSDDAANTITLALSGIPDAYSDSDVREAINTAFRRATSGPRVTLNFNRTAGTLTFGLAGLATVAGSGSYNDLTNRPTIPAAPASFALASSPTGRIPEANAASESVIGGSVTGQVITLTRRDGLNPITITIPTASAPAPATHTRYWARSADTTFAASEFLSATTGQSFTTDRITQPSWTGNEYIAIAVPDTTGDITRIEIDGRDQTGAFQRISGTLTISGTAYKVWRSNNRVNGSGDTIIITQA